jgi:RNA polymerase sigma-70 factor (ECF subfamily)
MDSAPATDRELILRVVAQDSPALDQLYHRYSRQVFSLTLRILSDAGAAEDVTQDVFLKLWRQPDSYNPDRGALGSWLLSVAHNRAIDVLRRRQLRDERPLPETPDAEDLLPANTLDPGDMVGLEDLAFTVRRALARIPTAQRQAIEMAFFEGKTHVEISAELGEPLGTAKTRIRLGMKKLRALLEEEGVEI